MLLVSNQSPLPSQDDNDDHMCYYNKSPPAESKMSAQLCTLCSCSYWEDIIPQCHKSIIMKSKIRNVMY